MGCQRGCDGEQHGADLQPMAPQHTSSGCSMLRWGSEGPVPKLAAKAHGSAQAVVILPCSMSRATAAFYNVLLWLLPVPVTRSLKIIMNLGSSLALQLSVDWRPHCFLMEPTACSAQCFLLAPSRIPFPLLGHSIPAQSI